MEKRKLIYTPSGKPINPIYWWIILALLILCFFPTHSEQLKLTLLAVTNLLSFTVLLIIFYRFISFDYEGLTKGFEKIEKLAKSEFFKSLIDLDGAVHERIELNLTLVLPSFICFIASLFQGIKLSNLFWSNFFLCESVIMLFLFFYFIGYLFKLTQKILK